MRKLLRCSVAGAIAAITLASTGAVAMESLMKYPSLAQVKMAAKKMQVVEQPKVLISALTPGEVRQTLVLNCEAIGQAQRKLDDASARSAQLTPADTGNEGAAMPASGAELYHIAQNQQRVASLAQKFNCSK